MFIAIVGMEQAFLDGGKEFLIVHIVNVILAGVDTFDFCLVEVNPDGLDALRGILDREREPDIPKPDNADGTFL